jgi:peptide/nickel transport system substrate-binding protein
MKRLRWQIVVVVITLVVVGVLLLSQQPVLTPILSQPASGGIYTEAMIGRFGRLNPVFDLYNPADQNIDRLIYSSLIRFDAQGVARPDLAESWGISQDGTIYNISIRPGAVWHDGRAVVADDVLFTLSLIRSQFSAYPDDLRNLWDQVEITQLDSKTLKFILPEPFAPFLDYLTFGILPKHLLEGVPADQLLNADFNLSPVGSGPYRFDRLVVDEDEITGVVLTVFDDYFGQKPFIEQVVFRYFETPADALVAYQEGEVLGISRITLDILDQALVEENLSIYSSRMSQVSMVMLNLDNPEVPFFQEQEVRQALLMGINRQWLIDRILSGQAVLADSPILPGTWAYYEGMDDVAYDPDAAIAILKKAGYVLPSDGMARSKDGVALTFTMLYPVDEFHRLIAESIQADWLALGVVVELEPVDMELMVNDYLAMHIYSAALVNMDMSATRDPDPYPFWHQSEATRQNYSQWNNRQASEYLEQARVFVDPTARLKLYRNFQVVFGKELPALLLYYPIYSYGVDVRVRGVQIAPLFDTSDRFSNVADWYLVTKRALEQNEIPAAP